MMRKKSNLSKWNDLFGFPVIASMCGLGVFFLYFIAIKVVWLSLLVGLYTSALIARMLLRYELRDDS